MVCHSYAGYVHAVLHSYNYAITGSFLLSSELIFLMQSNLCTSLIGSISSSRTEMDENGFGNDSQFIFLGLHFDSSEIGCCVDEFDLLINLVSFARF